MDDPSEVSQATKTNVLQTIRICCTGSDLLPLDAIEEFQGKLKRRGKKEIEQIITSILTYGFSFPFYIWNGTGHNYCLDGHGRILALAELRKRGYSLPVFPVVYIDATDEAEAKQKLMQANARYGTMTASTVAAFLGDISFDAAEINLGISKNKIDAAFAGNEDEHFKREMIRIPLIIATTQENYDIFEKVKKKLDIKDDEKTIMKLIEAFLGGDHG
jgi:hypothetical protein